MDSDYKKRETQGRRHFKSDLGDKYIMVFTSDPFAKHDVEMTARTHTDKTYLGEIKDLTNSGYERPSTKYPDYQIDYLKIDYLVTEALSRGRTPILYVRFTDKTYVWDLKDIPYKERMKMVYTNDKGIDYGRTRSLTAQTYLHFDEAAWTTTTTLD